VNDNCGLRIADRGSRIKNRFSLPQTAIPTPKSPLPSTLNHTMDWPIATVLLGTIGTIAVGVLKLLDRRSDATGDKWCAAARVVRGSPDPARDEPSGGRVYARATDLAEFRARLISLEQAHHVLRAEIRADFKELQATIRDLLNHKP